MLRAAGEFLRPLFGSSSATIVIFVPLAFLSGITGGFFGPLSLTVASSLIFSFLITWLAVPLAAERLVSDAEATADSLARRSSSVFHTVDTVARPIVVERSCLKCHELFR